MKRLSLRSCLVLLGVALGACTGGSGTPDVAGDARHDHADVVAQDRAPVDSGEQDVVVADEGPADTGAADAGAADVGAPDEGPADSGAMDASDGSAPPDAGGDDSGAPDGGGTSTVFAAPLTGAAVTPPVTTEALGTVIATLTGTTLEVRGTFHGLSSPLRDYASDPTDPPNPAITSAVHIHMAPAGMNGPFQVALTVNADPGQTSGSFTGSVVLNSMQLAALSAGNLYVDVHTRAFRAGEIRGQLTRQAFAADLSGASVVPAVTTAGSGQTVAILTGTTLDLVGTFRDLRSPLRDYATDPTDPPNPAITSAVHIHMAPAGMNGPFQVALTVRADADAMSGSFTGSVMLNPTQLAALTANNLYVDVHTRMFRAGELRGQLTRP